jgi:hypothetical protein
MSGLNRPSAAAFDAPNDSEAQFSAIRPRSISFKRDPRQAERVSI